MKTISVSHQIIHKKISLGKNCSILRHLHEIQDFVVMMVALFPIRNSHLHPSDSIPINRKYRDYKI